MEEPMVVRLYTEGALWVADWSGYWGANRLAGRHTIRGATIEEVMTKIAVHIQGALIEPRGETSAGIARENQRGPEAPRDEPA